MKVLFIYPDIITRMINFCPAVQLLSAVLKREGHGTSLLHINNDYGIKYDKNTIVGLSEGFDLFALTATSFNYKYANEIAGWLRDAYPSVLRVLGGSHATIRPEDLNNSNFDVFCIGEGDETMAELCGALREGRDWRNIPNLGTRFGTNIKRGFFRDLNRLPFWDFDIIDTPKILEKRNGFLSISFSRGCPYECTFCVNHLYKKIEIGDNDKMSDYLRRRVPGLAIEELSQLARKFKVKVFNIDDDLLTMNKKWMREFADGFRKEIYEPLGIMYIINARADTLTDDIVKMLSESGCKEARIGFETGNEEVRNELLLKKTSDDALAKAFKTLDNYGVQGVAFAMMGIPGESWDTFFDTINAVVRFQPKLIRMTFLFPYKYTRIYDVCVEQGLLKEGYDAEDNRDLRSPLKFEQLTDKEIFCFRFLFPWYVNAWWMDDSNYSNAIHEFTELSLSELEDSIPKIIAKDTELSNNCFYPHYRYFKHNIDYFALDDNIKNTIQN